VRSAGLFTDQNARVESSEIIGLSGRITLNEAVDPEAGGDLWKIRSGLNATTEAPNGDATLIAEMIFALGETRSEKGTLFQHVGTLASTAAQTFSEHEQKQIFAMSQFETLKQSHLANGVSTDSELQKMLMIETNYAANAKMMQAIEEMFDAIMRIA
jgi:flagellar hook-associated protein 1 FlgK